MTAQDVMNSLSALPALGAGVSWITSTVVWEKAPEGAGRGRTLDGGIYDDDRKGRRFDVLATIKSSPDGTQMPLGCESAPNFDPRQNRNNLLNDKRFLEKQVGSRLNADEPLRKTTI